MSRTQDKKPPKKAFRKPEKKPRTGSGFLETYFLYGKHPCLEALKNPRRKIRKILVTQNSAKKYAEFLPEKYEVVDDRKISKLLTKDAVHQGIAIEVEPLNDGMMAPEKMGNLVILLDEVTDPHNIGAIMRSASAFGASSVITTFRNSPSEGGVLAKSASGALEFVKYCRARNLVKTMAELQENGFKLYGLAGEAEAGIQEVKPKKGEKIGIVLGAEGKGLRGVTAEACDELVNIPIQKHQESLNVSNAAAVALWELSQKISG